MKLSELIRDYRKKYNLTQTALANKLFVSKQAISKWETSKGLPDISLYPVLSEMLNLSVDELLGKEKHNENKKTKKTTVIISSLLIALCVAIVVLAIIFVYKDDGNLQDDLKLEHIEETEKNLNISFPEIELYEYNDFTSWKTFNSATFPNDMYYFVFKNEIITIDNKWLEALDIELINCIPLSIREYANTCDYFKLLNKTTGEVNKAPAFTEENAKQEFIFYCIQISNKRLIVINFNMEMK